MEDRGGLHGLWCRVGWPRTYAGKLILGGLVCFVPWSLAAVLEPGLESPAALLGVVLLSLFLVAMTRPLRRTADELERTLGTVQHGDLAERTSDCVDLIAGYVRAVADRESRRRAVLEQAPLSDFRSGMPDRTDALERLRQSMSLATRDHLPLTVAIVEVEYVSAATDGDAQTSPETVFGAVGERLAQLLRGSDWGARWSEDSFLLALFSPTSGARVALERLLHDLSTMSIVTEDRRFRCVSTAGAVHVHPEYSVRECIDHAEAQLEIAHRQGGGSVAVAD